MPQPKSLYDLRNEYLDGVGEKACKAFLHFWARAGQIQVYQEEGGVSFGSQPGEFGPYGQTCYWHDLRCLCWLKLLWATLSIGKEKTRWMGHWIPTL
jgi:hypothetical protein